MTKSLKSLIKRFVYGVFKVDLQIEDDFDQESKSFMRGKKTGKAESNEIPVYPQPETTKASKGSSSRFFCRYCGTENKLDAVFCEKCGKKIV